MKFVAYRIALQKKAQIDWVNDDPEPSKIDIIKSVFSRNYEFDGWSYKYEKLDSEIIVGFLGRYHPKRVNLGPDKDWQESEADNWERKLVLIDPAEHSDGQKILIEGTAADKAAGFVSKLQNEINGDDQQGSYMYINPILEEQALDKVFDRYRNQVVEITLDFPIANMPSGIQSPLSSARKKFAEADASMSTVVKADNGVIDVSADVITESTNHAADVGADIKIEVAGSDSKKKRVVYDSSKEERIKEVSLTVANTIVSIDNKITAIVNKLFRSN